MPDFTIEGDPGAVRAKAVAMRTHGETFSQTGDALATVTTDGWVSRAGERFREKFDTEPDRWRDAGADWQRAAAALESYATALETAQKRAEWAKGEYARGEEVTHDAKRAYDADVSRAKREAAQQEAAGFTVNLTILPFSDPGEEIRQHALQEYAGAKSDLDEAAHTCAAGVKAGCAHAPEKRKWYEKVGAAVGGFFAGAGEALLDLGKLATFLTMPHVVIPQMLMDDLRGGLTAEEIAAKYKLKLQDAKDIAAFAADDPFEFGKTLGKAILDWDTWADDPARAAGHLLPDAVIAVLTVGSGTLATRGGKAAVDGAEGLAAVNRLDDLADLRHLDDIDDLADLRHLDDLNGLDDLGSANRMPAGNHVDLDAIPDWHQPGGEIDPRARDLVPDDFDPYAGLSRQDYYDRYYDAAADHWNYPKNDGFTEAGHGPVSLESGDVIDRFGRPVGRYASPADTPFPERALPPTSLTDEYHQYRVVKELPPAVTEGQVAPAFGMPGGGTQVLFEKPIAWYVEHGYLEPIQPR